MQGGSDECAFKDRAGERAEPAKSNHAVQSPSPSILRCSTSDCSRHFSSGRKPFRVRERQLLAHVKRVRQSASTAANNLTYLYHDATTTALCHQQRSIDRLPLSPRITAYIVKYWQFYDFQLYLGITCND